MLSVVLVRLNCLKGPAGAILSLVLFSFLKTDAASGSSLSRLSVQSSSKRFSITASAESGSMSHFTPILAAPSVQLELADRMKNKIDSYACSSFSYQLADNYLVCEDASTSQTITVDLKNSELNHFRK